MGNMKSAHSMLEHLIESTPCRGVEKKEIYRIGDLARDFDVSLRTLRFYEDRGLLSPERSGSTRLYSNADRRRLKLILMAKNVGFSLVDIQELLDIYDQTGDHDDVEFIATKFEDQLKRLNAQKAVLDRSIHELGRAIDCVKKAG